MDEPWIVLAGIVAVGVVSIIGILQSMTNHLVTHIRQGVVQRITNNRGYSTVTINGHTIPDLDRLGLFGVNEGLTVPLKAIGLGDTVHYQYQTWVNGFDHYSISLTSISVVSTATSLPPSTLPETSSSKGHFDQGVVHSIQDTLVGTKLIIGLHTVWDLHGAVSLRGVRVGETVRYSQRISHHAYGDTRILKSIQVIHH